MVIYAWWDACRSILWLKCTEEMCWCKMKLCAVAYCGRRLLKMCGLWWCRRRNGPACPSTSHGWPAWRWWPAWPAWWPAAWPTPTSASVIPCKVLASQGVARPLCWRGVSIHMCGVDTEASPCEGVCMSVYLRAHEWMTLMALCVEGGGGYTCVCSCVWVWYKYNSIYVRGGIHVVWVQLCIWGGGK